MSQSTSRGDNLAERLKQARSQILMAPHRDARDLPILHGLNTKGNCYRRMETVLAEATDILKQNGHVYSQANSIVIEKQNSKQNHLVILSIDGETVRKAEHELANVFICIDEKGAIEFGPPASFVSTLMKREPTLRALPEILIHTNRPVFDSEFRLCGPGYHPESKILVHGPEVEPWLPTATTSSTGDIQDRLPPHLKKLLSKFCFRTPADFANYLAMLLTGILTPHFLTAPKPIALVDGNQPGLGKTILVEIAAIIHDGVVPERIRFTSDDEISKQIGAQIREVGGSVFLFDNAKAGGGGTINSPTLEMNVLSDQISIRMLGKSIFLKRTNYFTWWLTMNDTKASRDLVSRGLPIRLYFEGQADKREFHGFDPCQYARTHRTKLLGELTGMAAYWKQTGFPPSAETSQHRCREWSRIVGGILTANGFPEFLTNLNDATQDFDEGVAQLASIAEELLTKNPSMKQKPNKGHRAAELIPIFQSAGVLLSEFMSITNQRGRSTKIGQFLIPHVNRVIPIEFEGQKGTACLLIEKGRSGSKLYRFEYTWDSTEISQQAEIYGNAQNNTDANPDAQPVEPLEAVFLNQTGGNELEWNRIG